MNRKRCLVVVKNIRKLTCGSAEIAKTTSDQINSRILESTYIVTGEMFSDVGLNSPKNGSKQANTDRKTRKKRHFIAFKNVKNLFVTVLIKSDVYLPNCLLNNHFSISIRMFLVSYTCFSHVALNQNCNEQNFHITNFHVDFRFSDSSFEATMNDVIGMTHRKMILDHDI